MAKQSECSADKTFIFSTQFLPPTRWTAGCVPPSRWPEQSLTIVSLRYKSPPRMTLLRAFECIVPSMTKTMQTERKRQRRGQRQRQCKQKEKTKTKTKTNPHTMPLLPAFGCPLTTPHNTNSLCVKSGCHSECLHQNSKSQCQKCPPGSYQVSWMGHEVWQRRENVLKFLSLWGALHLCELLCTLSWCHKLYCSLRTWAWYQKLALHLEWDHWKSSTLLYLQISGWVSITQNQIVTEDHLLSPWQTKFLSWSPKLVLTQSLNSKLKERVGWLTMNFQNEAPSWYKTPLRGPAKGENGRQVGCNGMVCYCNNADYCNQKEGQRVTGGPDNGAGLPVYHLVGLLLPPVLAFHSRP